VEHDATLYKVIEVDGAFSISVKFPHQHGDNGVRQSVAKSDESLSQLLLVDVARVVSVERAEAVLPVGDVLPESPKLLETDRATVLPVKHPCKSDFFFFF